MKPSPWPTLPPGSPRLWLLPVVAALAMLAIYPLGNQALFILLNQAASHFPDAFWSGLTSLGDTLVAFVLLLFFLRRRPELALAVLLAALPATLLSHGLKDFFDERRPYAILGDSIHVIGPFLKAGSFPSGHTTTAFVLATVFMLGLHSARHALAILLLALLVGFSRVAVGAHWPADIFGGILCAWASAWIGVRLARQWRLEDNAKVLLSVRLFLVGCGLTLLLGYDSGYPLARPWEQAIAMAALTAHLLPGWRLPADGA